MGEVSAQLGAFPRAGPDQDLGHGCMHFPLACSLPSSPVSDGAAAFQERRVYLLPSKQMKQSSKLACFSSLLTSLAQTSACPAPKPLHPAPQASQAVMQGGCTWLRPGPSSHHR